MKRRVAKKVLENLDSRQYRLETIWAASVRMHAWASVRRLLYWWDHKLGKYQKVRYR